MIEFLICVMGIAALCGFGVILSKAFGWEE
jgi:hypothetical protein